MEEIIIPFITWIIGIAAILLFLYFISRHNLWIRKYGLTLFLAFWFLGFTIYFIGYFFGSEITDHRLFHAISSLFSSIFSSGRIVTMEIDLKETGRFSEYKVYQTACVTIIFSAILLLATTVLANIGGGIIGRIRFIFLQTIGTRQNVYLIYGLCRETVYMAGDIHRQDPKATILLLHDRNENTGKEEDCRKVLENDLFQHGAAKLSFTSEKPLPFLMRIAMKCRKQTFLLLMDCVCWKNTSLLGKLNLPSLEAIPQLHLYILYEKGISECIAQESALQEWDIHWISHEELAARQVLMTSSFLDICPVCDGSCGRADQELKLAVVGYSQTAEELCRYLASCVQTAGMTVSLLLFDKKIQSKTAYFRVSNPEISKAASVVLMDMEPDSLEFYEFFQTEQNHPDGIFFAGDDEKHNTLYAFQLRELMQRCTNRNIPFFVLRNSIQEEHRAFELSGFQSFGCMEQIYSYDVLIGEELDTIAKAVHRYYKVFYGEDGDMQLLWKQASLYEKMSSRALAIHIPWKLKCAGFQKVPGKPDNTYDEELVNNPELMENLSIGEHLRWNAYLFAEGWKMAAPEELPSNRNKDKKRKLHACLVSWEELVTVGTHYNVDYQHLDRHFIKSLAQILQNAGYTIQKSKGEIGNGKEGKRI